MAYMGGAVMTVMTATNQAHVELTLINVDIGMKRI